MKRKTIIFLMPLSVKVILFLIFLQIFPWSALTLKAESGTFSQQEFKRKFGIGLAYLGGLIHYGFKKHWSTELRYFLDNASSENGNVSSTVIGLRGYRHFRTDKNLQIYTGLEGSYVSANLKDSVRYGENSTEYKTSGISFGGFGGVEYYLLRRLSISMDIGPYYISLKEQTSSLTDSGIEFVLNSSINFYFF